MVTRCLLIFALFTLVIQQQHVEGIRLQHRIPYLIRGRPPHGLRPEPLTQEQLSRLQQAPQAANISQLIDHFTPSDKRRWDQRYYYNLKFYKPNGPIFLMLGGEGPERGSWSVAEVLPYIQWAKNHSAAIYDLEHRFYGRSRPFQIQSVDNLKYLSSPQAIEDAAYFISYINEKMNYTNPKWIVFGGSYSGSLAAWLREKHPELVTGAVASSAPVQAQLDFYEYLEVVENALRSYDPKCADAVQEAFTAMSELIWTVEGRRNLSDTFVLVPRLNETELRYKDVETFFSSMFGYFQGAVQYSGDNAGYYARGGGIPEVCEIMTRSNLTYFDRLNRTIVYLTEFPGWDFTGVGISYNELINYLQDEQYYGNGGDAAYRSWVWQTCTEFGYFQSTDLGRNIFGSGAPINKDVDMCTDTFGQIYNIGWIAKSIHTTNKYFGGRDHFNGTNVVFPNGDIDPWHALGLYSNIQPSVVPILIHGTAHCADMYPPRAQDPPSLVKARELIALNIEKWLNGDSNPQEKLSRNILRDKKHSSISVESSTTHRNKMRPFTSIIKSLPLRPFEEEMNSREKIPPNLPNFIRGRPHRGLLVEPPAPINMKQYPEGFSSGIIVMPVDHFDATNTNTFGQRFWVNGQYAKPGGPHFLMIGGEGTANIKWLINPEVEIMRAARRYNAVVYMLEHRYYGESWPTPDQSTENLQWLTSEQALADLAQFILSMNRYYKLKWPQWITFGGSYPGMLSAWFRQYYPEMTVGALASSAPINAKVDFYEYLMVVANSLNFFNPKCARNVKLAFDEMHKLSMTSEGRVRLTELFTLRPQWNASTKVTDLDLQNFFSSIYGNFQGAVQYNNDNRGSYASGGGISEVCQFMVNDAKTPIENVADVNVYIANFTYGGFEYTDNLYQNYINYLKDINAKSSSRSWTYQTCNEFGFFQSTDIGENMFGGPTPVNLFIDTCKDVFGPKFTPRFVHDANLKSHKYYGGSDYYRGTNVLFTNGNIDPWHALSKYNGTGSVVTVLMNGTAHCADMYPPRAQDAPDLAPTRALIEKLIGEWLNASTIIQTTKQQSTSTNVPQANSTTASYLPSTTASKLPPRTASEFPTTTASKLPSITASKLPPTTASNLTSTTASNLNSTTASNLTSTTASNLNSTTASYFTTTTASKLPPTTASEFPTTTASYLPSTTASKLPPTTASEFPTTTASNLTSTTAPPTGASNSSPITASNSSSTMASNSSSTVAPSKTVTTSSANQLDYSTMNGIVIALVTMLIATL